MQCFQCLRCSFANANLITVRQEIHILNENSITVQEYCFLPYVIICIYAHISSHERSDVFLHILLIYGLLVAHDLNSNGSHDIPDEA